MNEPMTERMNEHTHGQLLLVTHPKPIGQTIWDSREDEYSLHSHKWSRPEKICWVFVVGILLLTSSDVQLCSTVCSRTIKLISSRRLQKYGSYSGLFGTSSFAWLKFSDILNSDVIPGIDTEWNGWKTLARTVILILMITLNLCKELAFAVIAPDSRHLSSGSLQIP